MHCIALHCTWLHCIALDCTRLHWIALHCTGLWWRAALWGWQMGIWITHHHHQHSHCAVVVLIFSLRYFYISLYLTCCLLDPLSKRLCRVTARFQKPTQTICNTNFQNLFQLTNSPLFSPHLTGPQLWLSFSSTVANCKQYSLFLLHLCQYWK